jgi:hypothetical protein
MPWIGRSSRRPSQGSSVWLGVMEIPGLKVVEERELVVSEEGDVEVVVATRLAIEEEVQRPSSTDPPGSGEAGEKHGNLLGLDGLPRPQVGVITSVGHSCIVAG